MDYITGMTLTIAAVCFLLRFTPFFIFRDASSLPAFLVRLGKYLPSAAMGMLVIYSLKDVSVTESPYGLPECISILCILLIHYWKRNTLLSILTGTLIYMCIITLF